jgi:acyl-ACP thioesterase
MRAQRQTDRSSEKGFGMRSSVQPVKPATSMASDGIIPDRSSDHRGRIEEDTFEDYDRLWIVARDRLTQRRAILDAVRRSRTSA